MSVEIEEQLTLVEGEEVSSSESSKKSTRSYTREFLLSLGELEVCKKLPNGFDESFLSEIHDTSYYGAQDRPRVLGSSPLQGFRRTDYGSSPPARGDSGTYSRGLQRWDSRSSGKSEGDSDPESGRRYGNQGRKTWQNTEHDGLLGSGSLPRPPGYATSGAAPRFRPNENPQLSKSNEPYQPPRPYKAGPYSRRGTKDSFNDETFGSSDCTAEDRVEEEKKRRAEFELMRKEHHKAFQENQKLNSDRPKDAFSEMVGLLENTSDSKSSSDLNKVLKTPHNDTSKLSHSSQAPPTRPLVPPGFMSGVADKSSASKSNVHCGALQVENLEVEGPQNLKNITQERGHVDWFSEMSTSSDLKANTGLSSIIQGVGHASSLGLPVVTDTLDNGESLGLDSGISVRKMLGEPVRSTSILDKLFVNGLTTGCESTSNKVEGDDPKNDDIWSPDKLQSKFTSWFLEEDKKTLGTSVPEKPNGLLSLIIEGEKGRSDGLNGALTAPISAAENLAWQTTSKSASVLTCEDLEQSILSEIGGENPKSQSFEKEEVTIEVKKDGFPGTPVDNSASHHLLSLLKGSMSSNNALPSLGVVERLPDDDQELGKSGLPKSSLNTSGVGELKQSDKTLTLEALFGSAFMTELHSAQRNSDGGNFPPKMGENGDGFGSHEENIKPTNDGGTGVKLPEEDSLINLVDPIDVENSIWVSNSSSGSANLGPLSSNTSVNVMEKLAALGDVLRDEKSLVGEQEPLFLRNPYDVQKPEIPYQNQHLHASSPQPHIPSLNHRTPVHPVDTHPGHIDPHMKFIPPMHHQFPTNMDRTPFTHSGSGFATFDHHIPSPALLEQMHMASNQPPPHLVRGFHGAAPLGSHLSHTPAGYIQEHNPMHVFPFGERQPNFGGPGMMPSGPEIGVASNPPEAFQRLLEMEMRANPKQMLPFAAGTPSRPMYGHELDMGYRYR